MAQRIAVVEDGVLHQPEQAGDPGVLVGSSAWWAWLDDPATRSFAFRCSVGHFTARKEPRQRGTAYWTAYRKVGGRYASIYLGKGAGLTLKRLSRVAAQLAERGNRSRQVPSVAAS